jgi:bacteriorhodopsin
LVDEETKGASMVAFGGGLLTFVIGMFVMFDSLPMDHSVSNVILIFGTLIGFVAFLAMGYGFSSIVRAATSSSRK